MYGGAALRDVPDFFTMNRLRQEDYPKNLAW